MIANLRLSAECFTTQAADKGFVASVYDAVRFQIAGRIERFAWEEKYA